MHMGVKGTIRKNRERFGLTCNKYVWKLLFPKCFQVDSTIEILLFAASASLS